MITVYINGPSLDVGTGVGAYVVNEWELALHLTDMDLHRLKIAVEIAHRDRLPAPKTEAASETPAPDEERQPGALSGEVLYIAGQLAIYYVTVGQYSTCADGYSRLWDRAVNEAETLVKAKKAWRPNPHPAATAGKAAAGALRKKRKASK